MISAKIKKKLFNLFLLIVLSSSPLLLYAQTDWNGAAGNTNWNDAGNWSAGIPTSGSNVTILNVASLPTLTSSETINSLVINSSASLTISSGGILTVNTTCTNQGTLNLNTGRTLSIGGDFTNNSTFNAATSSTVIFNGSSNTTVSGTGTITFQQLTISKTGSAKATFNKNITVEGTTTISAGATLELAAGISLNINGNLANNGTFTANNTGSTIVLGGALETELTNNDFSVYNLTVTKTAATPATNNDARVRLRSGMAITVDNHLQLNTGRIVGSGGSNLVIIGASATTSAPNANSFVEGRVRKIKGSSTNFVFPLGRNGRFGRLEITGLTGGAATDFFTAEYFGTAFNNTIISVPLDDVSNKEYWRLQRSGSTTCTVRLYWEDGTSSGINGPSTTVTLGELRVAQWNSSSVQWENRGNTATTGSLASSGTIDSNTGQSSNIKTNDFWSLGYDHSGGTNTNLDWNTITWIGTTGTDWHTATNWSPATLPTNNDRVVILGDRPNNPIISTSDAQISELVLSPNISPGVAATNLPVLTINASRTLTVGNDNTDGTLDNSGTITNNGTLTTTGQFDNNDNGIINNNLGASITACTQNTGSFRNGVGNGDAPTINNAGTITVVEEQRLDNNRGGTINNQIGGVIVSTGHFRNRNQTPGTANIVNNGTLQLLRDFQNDRTLSGTGTLDFTTGSRKRNSVVTGTSAITQQISISKTNSKIAEFRVSLTATNNVSVPANAILQINTGVNFSIQGNFSNSGTLTSQTGSTITFTGNTQDSQISGTLTGSSTFHHIVSSKSGGFATRVLSNIEVNGDLTNSAGTLVVDGTNTITLKGSFSNEGTFTPNNSNFTFAGSSDATIGGGGTTTFYDLTFNTSATNGITLNSTVFVDNSLTLTTGYVNTSSANLLVLNNGSTSGEGNATSYVRGPLRKVGTSSGGSFVFPVGKDNQWARVELLDFDATSTTDHFTAEYFNNRPPNSNPSDLSSPLSDISWQEYWDVARGNTGGGSGSIGARLKLYWENRSFSRIDNPATGDLRVVHYNSGIAKWEDRGQVNLTETATTGTVTTAAIQTSFSPWTFGSVSGAVNPLPVTLLKFTGTSANKQNVLSWQTIDESNIAYFEVQKSVDGRNFTTFTQIKAQNKKQVLTHYQAIDSSTTEAAVIYYRLKITEANRADEFSSVIALQNLQLLLQWSVYPNPFTTQLHLKFFASKGSISQFILYDLLGNPVLKNTFKASYTGLQQQQVNTMHLKSQAYVLKLINDQYTSTHTVTLIK